MDSNPILLRHIADGRNFRTESTSRTSTLITDKGRYGLSPNLDNKTLGLISAVSADAKKYIEKTQFDLTVTRPAPMYFRFREHINIDNNESKGCKIDINAAYWTMARHLFLSEKTYQAGLTSKHERLKALGALATSKIVKHYENGVCVKTERKLKDTRELYMEICRKVDEVIDLCFYEFEEILGYWVDCVFVESTNAQLLKDITGYFSKKGFAVHIEYCKFGYQKRGDNIYLLANNEKEKDYYTGI
jgi:hypothetical protein